MTTDNRKSITLSAEELIKIADWAKSDLLLQAPLIRIETHHAGGIGQAVTAIALDKNTNPVGKLDATDYGNW